MVDVNVDNPVDVSKKELKRVVEKTFSRPLKEKTNDNFKSNKRREK